ncbi:TrlF family AAA-like ATPase [Vibrio sp. 10N.237.312.B06]|uniref:TrlF family AAA-like ATPase n=1 Tax=Vibrio sp. 10N.237.312.B06 TaxID=3229974 RepID=UPI00354E05B2
MPEASISNKWYKFDFHTHTPASLDYREPDSPTARDWLQSVMTAKLDCVAITDHNTGEWVDILKSEYSEVQSEDWFRPVTIFPGCELTLSLGATRIHLLAVFDPSATTEDITRFLGSCELQGSFGDPENCFTTLSIETVVKKIRDANGIAIPAHIDITKGLLHNVTSTNPDLKKHLSLFESAQFIDSSYQENESIHIELRKDTAHLAMVRGSDAHTLRELGASYSWIKMGSPNKDGLDFAVRDHAFCVLNQEENPNKIPRSYIKSLTVKGMRHCGMNPQNVPTVQFHPLFNSIIGGRGTGKSTFIEALRLSLGRSEDTEELTSVHQDISAFVEGVTTPTTDIEITLKRNSSDYKANWKRSSPISFERLNEGSWIVDEGSIKERFPVNIYSQKQINALSSNPNSLLELVDRSPLVNISEWRDNFDEKRRSYLQLCSDEVELNRSIAQEGAKRSRLMEVSSDITNFESGGHSQILFRNQLMSSVTRTLENAGDVSEIATKFDELCQLPRPTLDLSPHELPFNVLKIDLEAIHAVFDREITNIFTELEQLKLRLEQAKIRRESSIENSNWMVVKKQSEQRYQDIVADYEERGVEFNSQEYEEWLREKETIEVQLAAIEEDKLRRESILEEKEELLSEIRGLRSELQSNRQQFIDEVLSDNEYVQMTIRPFSDVSKVERTFRELIGNERFASVIYEPENENTLLHGLIHSDSTYDAKIEAHKNLIDTLTQLVNGIEPDGFRGDRRFIEFLKEKYASQPEFLARLACWIPDDFLEVKYSQRGNGTQFTSINKGSAGQKAAAILAFLLSHGDEPIIVDQPEDDLDNALVYSLIVNQIQSNKKRRQIIIVTHNPNIVVNGDAELVNVMEFRGGQVQIKTSGSLIEQNIRDEVCEIMEGGREAFNKRFQRISQL